MRRRNLPSGSSAAPWNEEAAKQPRAGNLQREWLQRNRPLATLVVVAIPLVLFAFALFSSVPSSSKIIISPSSRLDDGSSSMKPSTSVLRKTSREVSSKRESSPTVINAPSLTWPNWKKCDQENAFVRRCKPQPATCNITAPTGSKHGIGNALMTTYSTVAEEVFAKGCAPILEETGTFHFLDYVHVPNVVIPTPVDKKCVVYSLSQPKEQVLKTIRTAQEDQGLQVQHLPLVAVHVRTGWADEMARRAKYWDAVRNCEQYHEKAVNSTGTAVWDRDMILDDLVAKAMKEADEAFGRSQWRLYVASDAPAVRHYVASQLMGHYAGSAMYVRGAIGHNTNIGGQVSQQELLEIQINAVAEVILLSHADILVRAGSKFPGVALMRSMCPQRDFSLRGMPRHPLVGMGDLARGYNDGKFNSSLPPELPPLLRNGGKGNPCMQEDNPLHACLCYTKIAHGG